MSDLPAISSHLPDIVNLYISTRAQRLALDAQAALVKEQEDDLKRTIIAKFRESDLTALGADNGLVKMKKVVEPFVNDWRQLYDFIIVNDAWELLHKRVTHSAVKERWDDGIEVPGVGRTDVYSLSVSKL